MSTIFSKYFFLFFLSIASFCSSAETVLLLIRHGQTDWNVEKRWQGHCDNPLNEKGVADAKQLAEKMLLYHGDISAIYSSDLQRAFDTAEETAKILHLAVQKRPLLREINWGQAEGLTHKETKAIYGEKEEELLKLYPYWKERWDFSPVFPEAETYTQLANRMKSELILLAESHLGEKIAVFSHGRAIRTFLIDVLDSEKAPYIDNCAVVKMIYNSDTSQLEFIKVEKYPSP